MKTYQTLTPLNGMPLARKLARSWRSVTAFGRALRGTSRVVWATIAMLALANPIVPTPTALAEDSNAYWLGWSPIKITEKGFDFGGKLYAAGAPTTYGWLGWYMENGQLRPALYGHIHLDDVRDLCARMRIDYYTGDILWTTKYGGQVCAPDDKHHSWQVSINEYSNSKIDKVRVSVEKLTATKDWAIVGSETQVLKKIHDKVKITEDGFDFGGRTFVAGAPTDSGEVIWTWSGAQVSPRLTGTLHVNNSASACARIHIEYFKVDGIALAEKFGGKVCAADNKHYVSDIDLEKYSDNKLAYIKIGLQTLGTDDKWRTIGTATSHYVKVYPDLCTDRSDCLHSAETKIE